jgi:hypothetical protein
MKLLERMMKIRRAVIFRYEEGLFGSCYPTNSKTAIHINLARHWRCDPLKTYIHELLHILYPTLSEKNIRKLENHVWEHLTTKEQFLLARKLYNRKWRACEKAPTE